MNIIILDILIFIKISNIIILDILINYIFNDLNLRSQIRLRLTYKYFLLNLAITDLLNIDYKYKYNL